MHVLRLEYSVPDFDEWKRLFDSDPADRKASGVIGYEILRSVEDPNHVLINLQFANGDRAHAFLASVRKIWESLGPDSIRNPQAHIAEHVVYKQV